MAKKTDTAAPTRGTRLINKGGMGGSMGGLGGGLSARRKARQAAAAKKAGAKKY